MNLVKKKHCIGLMTACIMLALSGCSDPMPELSEEDSAKIAEYAAGVLVRQNKNYSGKIVSDEVIEAQLRQEQEFKENTERYVKAQETLKKEEAEEAGKEPKAQDKSDMTIAELPGFLNISPITLSYQGHTVCDAWPEDSDPEEVFFALTATPGHQLCVLKFALTNPVDEEVPVNIYDGQYRFSVGINGGRVYPVQATYALEDLAVYKENLPAGETREAVLILELPEEEVPDIQSMTLSVSGSEGSAKISLE